MSSPSEPRVRRCEGAKVRRDALRAGGGRSRGAPAFARSHARTCAPSRLALALLAALGAASCARAEARPARELRVCADPNNLPFSNARGEGFENRIAELVARD